MFSEIDKKQLEAKGISESSLKEQLERFKKGFPFLKIESAATAEKGIMRCDEGKKQHYQAVWENYLKGDKKIVKFVPASGAASRMFKDLFSFLDASYSEPTTPFEKDFFQGLDKFAFYASLDAVCKKNEDKDIAQLLSEKSYKAIVKNLLSKEGLNYGNLPKGLLEFHKYSDSTRRPIEEHLVEGALYASNASGKVNIHFTVSPEDRGSFESLVASKSGGYEKEFGVKFDVSYSEQKSSTDTVAADMDNNAFRDVSGAMLFRPGGHGALIENLNDVVSDIIFVKNIDNTIPDRLKKEETYYKKVLAGVLVEKQAKAFEYLRLLDSGNYTHEQLIEILYFLQNDLNIKNPETKLLEDAELSLYLKKKLNRPMRVCGMVKNEGEPGGGPFLTVNSDGTISPQILESSQIDEKDEQSKNIIKGSTHFNPVDLVCAVKNYKGEKFNLPKYVDVNTGFISMKSKDGKTLKALELPGLWNGAMSDWNTIFVEVPVATFNPVKTVNDLLRSNHL